MYVSGVEVGMYEKIKVMDLKPEMNNVNLIVRVLQAGEPKIIMTRSGQRTISEALVGDETGRVKLTLWGHAAGSVKEGEAIEIKGAWTTAFQGRVQLNIGGAGNIRVLDNESVPQPEEIPDSIPTAPSNYRPRRRPPRRRPQRRQGFRK